MLNQIALHSWFLMAPAPVVEPIKTPYFSMNVGDAFEYSHSLNGDEMVSLKLEIVKATRAKSSVILSIAQRPQRGRLIDFMDINVSDKGVSLVKWSSPHEYTFKFIELKLPWVKGQTWSETFIDQEKRKYQYDYTMGDTEDIEVKAGKFTAIRVDMVSTMPDEPHITSQYSTWYARDIGIVKQLHIYHFTKSTYKYELESFKSGKDAVKK